VVGIGDVLANKYRIEQVLGHGATGPLLAGRHEQLDQLLAIKILTPELQGSEGAVARFLRRAQASVVLHSENVARVFDVGTLEDGLPYVVMEFLEGCDLAHELDERVALPVGEAVDYVLQTCEALAEAHTLGIVHRDLKPANLFRTRRPDGSAHIKVLGFGISEAQGSGSVLYMSPEQERSPETVDARSDIWSLGIVLSELLTGYPPRMLDVPVPILAAVVSDGPPESTDPSSGLEDVILKCLERDASRRYADVVELADALQVYTPSGGAAVARILATVRAVEARSRSQRRPRPAWEGPTLESPRRGNRFPDGGRHGSAGRAHSQRLGRRSWRMGMLIGAAATLYALSSGTCGTRSRTAISSAAFSTNPSAAPPAEPRAGSASRVADLSRDPDAAVDLAASAAPPVAAKRAAGKARVKATPTRVAVPPKASTPGPPALDNGPDPLDGRF